MNDRFGKLEGGGNKPLPPEIKDALKRIDRFNALEIGLPTQKPPQPPAAPPTPKVTCVHCGQPNEVGRETCWACYRFVALKAASQRPAGPEDITLVIDGATYRSNQKNLPEDIAELMVRIRAKGYSPELLSEWRTWRATRNSAPEPKAYEDQQTQGEDEAHGIKVFRGQRVSVLRIDGKVYTSDDPDLSPELRQLFEYIAQNGVTPELMDYLREMGQVKLRPETTAYPSDGDLDFWKQVGAAPKDAKRELERKRAEEDLVLAQRRYNDARFRMTASAAGIVLTILYILGSIFLR